MKEVCGLCVSLIRENILVGCYKGKPYWRFLSAPSPSESNACILPSILAEHSCMFIHLGPYQTHPLTVVFW